MGLGPQPVPRGTLQGNLHRRAAAPERKKRRQVLGFRLSQGDMTFQDGQNTHSESEGASEGARCCSARQSQGGGGSYKRGPSFDTVTLLKLDEVV